MPSVRFFKDKTTDGKEGRDMVEITHEADKNSVIVPAGDEQKTRYPQEWSKYEEGKRHTHRASAQTTPKSEMQDDPDKDEGRPVKPSNDKKDRK